jgi:hypothetical protein
VGCAPAKRPAPGARLGHAGLQHRSLPAPPREQTRAPRFAYDAAPACLLEGSVMPTGWGASEQQAPQQAEDSGFQVLSGVFSGLRN